MPRLLTLTLTGQGSGPLHPERLHGVTCRVLDPVPGEHRGRTRPFSVRPPSDTDGGLHWRVGWLLPEEPRVAPSVGLGPHRYAVSARGSLREHYAALASTPPRRAARITVLSALYFRRSRRDHPLPEPGLVLQSLARRWDAFAPAALHIPTPRLTELIGTVFVDELDGRTVRAPVSTDREQTGFVGSVTLALVRSATDEQRRLFAALMRYAEFAGVGAQTTHGFGAVDVEVR